MAIKLAGQYRIDDDKGQPTEDSETYAEALIVADAAIKGYDDNRGVDLPGYVHICIKRRFVDFRRVRNSRSRRLHLNALQEDFSFDQLADLRPIEAEHNESRVCSLRWIANVSLLPGHRASTESAPALLRGSSR